MTNDFDTDNDRIKLISATQPAFGTTQVDGNSVIYRTNAQAAVVDSFNYIIADNNGGTAEASVTIDISETLPISSEKIAKDRAGHIHTDEVIQGSGWAHVYNPITRSTDRLAYNIIEGMAFSCEDSDTQD